MTLFEKIIQLLDENKIWYQVLAHEPVWTSQQAAAVRPEISLRQGAKAMVLKYQKSKIKDQSKAPNSELPVTGYSYFMVVLPGDQRVDYKKVARFLGIKDCTLASAEEVEKVVGIKIGAVSPLGHLSGLETLVDSYLLENEVIAFNAGDHSKTVIMKSSDYLKISSAKVSDFGKV